MLGGCGVQESSFAISIKHLAGVKLIMERWIAGILLTSHIHLLPCKSQPRPFVPVSHGSNSISSLTLLGIEILYKSPNWIEKSREENTYWMDCLVIIIFDITYLFRRFDEEIMLGIAWTQSSAYWFHPCRLEEGMLMYFGIDGESGWSGAGIVVCKRWRGMRC